MGKRVAFIGHRTVYYVGIIRERVKEAIENCIADGYDKFIMGAHGEFDKVVLEICRKEREIHPQIKIEVVLTSYHAIERKDDCYCTPYDDVETVFFDIEDFYFKRQITESNRKMLDISDMVICYVEKERVPSGAKKAADYAAQKGMKIINVFRAEDFRH